MRRDAVIYFVLAFVAASIGVAAISFLPRDPAWIRIAANLLLLALLIGAAVLIINRNRGAGKR